MTIKPEGAAQYARRADPESSVWYLGCLFTVLADSQETGGQYGLIESLSPKGTEPPRHVHSREDETFYLLEGEITFYIGDETYKATPGMFVSAPRGVPHSYTFETDVIRMLVLVAPGGFEEFFRPPQSSEPAQAMEPPANQPLAPSAKPLAHGDAPVAPVESAPGLLEAQPGVDGQVLVHLLVGVEPYLRQAIRHGLPLREGHELAPEAPPLVPRCDGHVA